MILSKRERYILIAVVAALALLVLDRAVLTPLMERRDLLSAQITKAREDLALEQALSKDLPRQDRRWNDMVANGLLPDASSAEQQVQAAMHRWARESRLTLTQLSATSKGERIETNARGERLEGEKQFHRLVVSGTGTGTWASVRDFLWRIRESTIPVRVTELQVTSPKETSDQLTVQISVSTLFRMPDASPTSRPAGRGDQTAWIGGR